MQKKAIIIGAGPAGLTAAYELLKRTDIVPIILEKSEDIGGISKTINYKGNRMDMGPHRFFSKSDRVMNWWLHIMPLVQTAEEGIKISYQNKSRELKPDAGLGNNERINDPDKVMLVIQRLTRIYFLRKFFAYPIQLSVETLKTLGLIRTIKIMISFLWIRLFPIKPEQSLEDFIINKFGRQLYLLFFKDYTEKVWGVPCHEISAEWGAQRIKGVSLSKAILQAVRSMRQGKKNTGISQKETETSLIEQFLYPKHGPGSLWEEVARQIQEMGGKIYLNQDVQKIYSEESLITSVNTINSLTGQAGAWEGDYFFSTMPVKELIAGMDGHVPEKVKEVANGLQYRDFINVGILLRQLSDKNGKPLELKDNWIYIQERDVRVGRLMIYNNWGDGMIKDPNTTWIGMEYFCNKTDTFWAKSDHEIQFHAIQELEKMALAQSRDVLDITIQRMEKTYPAYFGTYSEFDRIRSFTDSFENLFLVGRNGMHKYNNADHSMLTAMVAVDNIIAGEVSKANIWAINTEQEYHEEKKTEQKKELAPKPSWITLPESSFKDYIWKNKLNRAYVLIGLFAFVIQFILFKIKYPFANYMPDSYSYIETAARNTDVNIWPVAYSKFLRLLSVFTHSDTIVVGIQYMFLQSGALLFLFTVVYFLQPGKIVKNVLYAFFCFNPIPLYAANYISADALFIALSLLWLTTLLWILYKPKTWQIYVHALVLFACFIVRYNALYYPVISAIAFIISRQNWKRKLSGISLGLLLIFGSASYTSNKMHSETGIQQFSPFGGWQLANNALYMYQHIPSNERKIVPARFAKLESLVRAHMDTLSKVKFTHDDSVNSYYYLWSRKSPLYAYLEQQWKKDSTTSYFTKWASQGPLFSAYAFWLIRQYPVQYVQSFVLPNAIKLAVPPEEFLDTYNMGKDSVGQLAKEWFNYKSLKVSKQDSKDKIGNVSWYPIFSALVNTLLIIVVTGLIIFGDITKSEILRNIIILVSSFWLANSGFSIIASPIVLRYQIFPILLIFATTLILTEVLYKTLSIANQNHTLNYHQQKT